MSVVEDVRQVIQDFVAPELKSLDTRVTHLETSINQRFANAETVANARHETTIAKIEALRKTTTSQIEALRETTTLQIETLREVLSAQIVQLASVVTSNHASMQEKLDLNKRIERIENFQAARYELARPVGPPETSKP